MKSRYLVPVAAFAILSLSACGKKEADVSRLKELERRANEAVDRQKELERQLEDQRLATERDAIERERMQIEEARVELERTQGEAAAAQAEAVRKREEALAAREGKLEQIEARQNERESELINTGAQLTKVERELAGREALAFENPDVEQVPVADYGMFYDSLSSYGSWFETEDYGYVWQPVVVRDSNWRPYSRGRWICSDRGWTWVSDEPFGWATYHYGRWALIRGRGWVWVPGTEWAPCWVTWRESRNHIGWAPLPPETLAYRNHRWDSTVEVLFGISSSWFSFVEINHFDRPVYQYCLPVSSNYTYIQETTNITYINIVNRQVICGGPKYREIGDRIGRPLPFWRLEIDSHPRPSRDAMGMKPRIKGDRLLISAPNLDADWNAGIKPNRLKGKMDSLVVERDEPLRPELAERFKNNREESRRIATRTISELGGAENFKERRTQQLEENRQQMENPGRGKKVDERVQAEEPAVQKPERIHREQIRNEEVLANRPEASSNAARTEAPRAGPTGTNLPPNGQRPMAKPPREVQESAVKREEQRQEVQREVRQPERQQPQRENYQPADSGAAQKVAMEQEQSRQREAQQNQARQRQEQLEKQREAAEAQKNQEREAMRQREIQKQEARQRQEQLENQRAAEAQKQAMEQQRLQERERQEQSARQEERARQQQQEQQRESERQRQREESQRQQEQSRQREQDDNQKKQDRDQEEIRRKR